ncbi:DinB family protein [Mucilaginibacter sp. dw_454]|uniref:DinB family protein n=1 Tax=Mucilaginibacter sp. dw_454 TaxID=2720079 RepID=UPI001BD56D01|nr:DinB family protein [Mucilaginibacter sp. dw_454]
MADNHKPEVWLRGPLDGIPPLVQPVAHALLQAREEVNAIMADFPEILLWVKPVGLASPGFHLQHLAGVLDRLFTYAKGQLLTQHQLNKLSLEGHMPEIGYSVSTLLEIFNRQVEDAVLQLSSTDELMLTEKRGVGRAQVPSTVIGLYTHAAEHVMRHVGQLLVTARMLQG